MKRRSGEESGQKVRLPSSNSIVIEAGMGSTNGLTKRNKSGSLPGFHLILQPMLGNCGVVMACPASTESKA